MLSIFIIKVIGILAVCQTGLLFLTFVRKKGTEYQILSYFFLVLAILLIGHYIGGIREFWSYSTVSIICHQFIYLLGPLYFLYVRQATNQNNDKLSVNSYLLHFLPFVLMLLSVIFVLIRYNQNFYYYTFSFYSNGLLCLYFPVYLCLIIFKLKKAGLSVQSLFAFSNIKKFKRNFWIGVIGSGFILISILKIIIFFSWNLVKSGQLCIDLSTLTLISAFLFTASIIYLGLGHSNLFLNHSKYNGSQLKETDKERLYQKIILYFETEKPYLNSEFKLHVLSYRLNIPRRYVSQILNEQGSNFNELVNRYRINEAKSRILANGTHNLYQIALDVGYNSKSTFNAAFKKQTGMTPKTFKNNVQNN